MAKGTSSSGRAYQDQRDGYGRGGPRQGGSDYVVAPGDTVYSIAQRHGMSTTELAELNQLNGSTIHPGQRLRVRGPEYTSTNRYKTPSVYEPGNRDRGGAAYADDDRKAPPAYSEDHGSRYGSYSGYAGSMPKPAYARDNDDRGRDDYRGSGQSRPYADHPVETEKRYDPGKRYEAATPPRSDAPYYARPSRTDRPSYAERPSPSNGPSYSEQPREEKGPPYAERQAYAGNPDYEEEPQDQHQDHYVSPDERDDGRAEEPRHEPRRLKAKGSYYNYSAKPGDTVADVARRNGISVRELSEINDVPPSARLYPGQVLRLPKGRGYDQSDRRDQGEDRDDRAPSRRGRPGYDDRTSQKTPGAGERVSHDGERRVAQAQAPQERGEPRANDAAPPARPEADRAPAAAPEPIMAAANRDMGPAETQPGGEKTAQACESLLASPASRSAQTFREPVQGMVTAKFGSKTDGSFNDGIDFSVPKGTPVKASENGVVAYAGNELPGFGNLVLVRHADGFVTAYAHNDELLVHRCDVVKRGQIISKAGASGTTSPQLHFELRKDFQTGGPGSLFCPVLTSSPSGPDRALAVSPCRQGTLPLSFFGGWRVNMSAYSWMLSFPGW